LGAEYRRNVPQHRMSTLQDLLAGRPLEVHETIGYAYARAVELGLDLPMLECFTRLTLGVDRTQRASASGS
ncbi:MAG: ketopantoate reductase C-terminal domain-containing protein, partial [Steroidobacteraceae bacterium]